MDILIVFTSYYFADKANQVLENTDIRFKLVALPPELSDVCGMAIRVSPDYINRVQVILKEHRISPSHIYWYKKGEQPILYVES